MLALKISKLIMHSKKSLQKIIFLMKKIIFLIDRIEIKSLEIFRKILILTKIKRKNLVRTQCKAARRLLL